MPEQPSDGAYVGDELERFARARHWKRYWSGRLGPYVHGRVLDVGAGLGASARQFARHAGITSWQALEPDAGLVARMRACPAADFPPGFEAVQGTLDDMDASREFDCILYIDVLEHIEDDRDELERAAAHLLPGGRILVLAPAHPFLYSPFDSAVGHVRRYTRASLARAKPDALLQERIRYLDCVGLFASLANRMLLRASQPTPAQIRLWDDAMVPVSARVDRWIGFTVGKTIIGSFRKPGP